MTRDDIIRLAREAAEATNTIVPLEGPLFVTPFIERFAALVAAAEREACAKVCEGIAEEFAFEPHTPDPVYCAAAIRARSNTGIKWEVEP
jgi:hypothetical protein